MTITRSVCALTAAAAIGASTLPVSAAGSPQSAQDTMPPQAAGPAPQRGDLLSAHKLRSIPRRGVARYLRNAGWDASRARYGVDAYRLVYRTVDVGGESIRASGLVVLPRNASRRLRAVSYTHGTTSYKPDVASNLADRFVTSPALTYGSAGFAAVLPDYLGLGKGPGHHPWMHVPSETTASLDMLRASRDFARAHERQLKRRVHITGFSQGASAALGLARTLQRGERHWFRPGSVAPIAGAYDFADAELPALLDGRLEPRMSVAYTAYFLVAWNRLHGLYDQPGEVFQRPYASRVEGLFDGTTPGPVMLRSLPKRLEHLLTERGTALLSDPPPRLRSALRVADSVCKSWTPRRPVRLYAAQDDEQAAPGNTRSCHRSFRERGVRVPVVDVGAPDHEGSRHLGANVAGTSAAVRWFLRRS